MYHMWCEILHRRKYKTDYKTKYSMKKILLIDCDALCWHVFHGMPPLTHEERGTSVIYGFLNNLFELQTFNNADRIAFAWDSKKSKRRKLFPGYKAKRRAAKKEYTEEELEIHKDRIRQFRALRRSILPKLGFSNNFMTRGLEGDDIIASIALEYRDTSTVKIIARDGDLFQLLNPQCTMFDLAKRTTIDEEYFFEKYGIYPDMWGEVKSIAGCVTDEVPGIYNVGNDRAIQYLLGNMKTTSVLYKRIVSNPEILELTKKLTVLPYKGTPTYTLKSDTCTVGKLKKVAREFGLQSYLSRERLKQFRGYFCNGNQTNTEKEIT